MIERVTFGDVHRLLDQYGFVREPGVKRCVLFKHDESGAVLVFRPHRLSERVDPMTLSIVRWRLVWHEFLEDDMAFYVALHGVFSKRKRKQGKA